MAHADEGGRYRGVREPNLDETLILILPCLSLLLAAAWWRTLQVSTLLQLTARSMISRRSQLVFAMPTLSHSSKKLSNDNDGWPTSNSVASPPAMNPVTRKLYITLAAIFLWWRTGHTSQRCCLLYVNCLYVRVIVKSAFITTS